MKPTEAKKILQKHTKITAKTVTNDADTVILQIQDMDRGPRNFQPEHLATLLKENAVFDAWVEDNKFFVQMN